ncbi:outer membrane lipoprotein carrier protein LolA [Desulfobacula sp.]|uniref:LolA family protein n=1 Tax=Desulfobacula sp. TaxID=2593537 RepID=UPI002605CE04|nr:outer membrane lipoprotein carrier protein LolA [Desulfobacula sp.]
MTSIIHRAGITLFSIALGCCIFFSTASAVDYDRMKEDVLTAIEKKYAGKDFKADFTQISRLDALDITERASGSASFSHPGKMKWEYMEPEHHEIITNGKWLWIFRPQENQVMKGDAAQFFKSGAGGAFLSDISLVRKNYSITIKQVTTDYVAIELVAKKQTPEISSIVIRISKKTNEIVRVVSYNPYDDTTLFEFTHIQFGKIDPEVFEFKAPQGVDIINMD